MKLSHRVSTLLRHWLGVLRYRGGRLAGAWAVTVLALEVFGRFRGNEWHDLAALCVLLFVAGLTVARHRAEPYRWIRKALAWGGRRLSLWSNRLLVWGADLRGGSEIPFGWPRRYTVAACCLLLGNAFLLWRRDWFPDAVADLLASLLYTAYLLAALAFWGALAMTAAVMGVLVAAAGQDVALRRGWSRRRCILAMIAAEVLVLPAGLLLPAWVAIALQVGAPLALAVGVSRAPARSVLWRRAGELWECRRCDSRWVCAGQLVLFALVLVAMSQAALGERLWDPEVGAGSRPITRGLGLLFVWLSAGGMTSISALCLVFLRRRGFEPRDPELAPLPPAREMELRHRILAGFEGLFRAIAGRTFHKGEGFWIALQHWFAYGLVRDTEEDDVDPEDSIFHCTVGPLYDRVFSREARQYYAHVMSCLDLDLIFLEDGVEDRFGEVLNVLFEVYDTGGGRQRVEERHFAGLIGLRVVIHDFDMAQPLFRTGYAEPDYSDIGRARILHVFQERPEDEEPELPPVNVSSLPLVSSLV